MIGGTGLWVEAGVCKSEDEAIVLKVRDEGVLEVEVDTWRRGRVG